MKNGLLFPGVVLGGQGLQQSYGGYADAKFNLLKCIDMYRSRELAELVRKYVPHPKSIGDKPAKRKQK